MKAYAFLIILRFWLRAPSVDAWCGSDLMVDAVDDLAAPISFFSSWLPEPLFRCDDDDDDDDADDEEENDGGGDSDGEGEDNGLPQGPSGIFDGFDFAGCFQRKESLNAFTVSAPSINERAVECRNLCSDNTKIFGVIEEDCFCFTEFDPPQDRLSLGACSRVQDDTVQDQDRMEMYVALALTDKCPDEPTRAVRDGLVLQDNAQFGFDIVSNTFRDTIFEFYPDECGTNIYEVSAAASSSSGSMRTTKSGIQEYTRSIREDLSTSWEASVEVGYQGALVEASVQASAAGDDELNKMMETTGASGVDSEIYTSVSVKRVAEVELKSFDNRYSFVSFNQAFRNLLTAYRNSNYTKEIGEEIIGTYGEFVLTRGLYGGYGQFRSTMTRSSLANTLQTEQEVLACFEASAKASAGVAGVSASVSGSYGECKLTDTAAFDSARNAYSSETSQQELVGGSTIEIAGKPVFVVEPGEGVLLKEKDKYPTGDDGVRFRLLSDFLDPKKISPLEIRATQITENEFGLMRERLQQHILEYLTEISDRMDGCGCDFSGPNTVLPYIQTNEDGTRTCGCYGPQPLNFTFSIGPEGWKTDTESKKGANPSYFQDLGGYIATPREEDGVANLSLSFPKGSGKSLNGDVDIYGCFLSLSATYLADRPVKHRLELGNKDITTSAVPYISWEMVPVSYLFGKYFIPLFPGLAEYFKNYSWKDQQRLRAHLRSINWLSIAPFSTEYPWEDAANVETRLESMEVTCHPPLPHNFDNGFSGWWAGRSLEDGPAVHTKTNGNPGSFIFLKGGKDFFLLQRNRAGGIAGGDVYGCNLQFDLRHYAEKGEGEIEVWLGNDGINLFYEGAKYVSSSAAAKVWNRYTIDLAAGPGWMTCGEGCETISEARLRKLLQEPEALGIKPPRGADGLSWGDLDNVAITCN